MSRASIVFLLLSSAAAAHAQEGPDDRMPALLAEAKKLTAIDKNGCLRSQEDIIIVCGENEENRNQRVFQDRTADEDRIRRGEASTTKAARCIGTYPQCPHRLHKLVGTAFGKAPEPAIPLEEVYRGLPDPEMVVPEGSGGEAAAPPD
ncbi:MAG: hypothetical protein ACRCY3_13215 [Sphingorhabdus sp.]